MDVIRLKGATEAQWLSVDPILKEREPGLTLDAENLPIKIKYGDGVRKWSELPYFEGSGGSALFATSQILEWDESNNCYKPYSAKKSSNPGYPYFFIHPTDNTTYTSILKLDGTLYVSALQSAGLILGMSVSSNSYFSGVTYMQLANYFNSIVYAIRIENNTSLHTLDIHAYTNQTPVVTNPVRIGDPQAKRNGKYIEIDDLNVRFKLAITKILWSEGTANKYLMLDANKEFKCVSPGFNRVTRSSLEGRRGGVNDPTLSSIGGLLIETFSGSAMNELFFILNLPADYQEGSDISLFLEWCPLSSPSVDQGIAWKMDYSWTNNYSTVAAITTLFVMDLVLTTGGLKKRLVGFPPISGAGKTISSTIMLRVYRDAAYVNDNYLGAVALFTIGVAYASDTMGSTSEFSK